MQGLVDLVGWLHTEIVHTRPETVTHPGTNRPRRRVTSFMRQTPLTTKLSSRREQMYDGLSVPSQHTAYG